MRPTALPRPGMPPTHATRHRLVYRPVCRVLPTDLLCSIDQHCPRFCPVFAVLPTTCSFAAHSFELLLCLLRCSCVSLPASLLCPLTLVSISCLSCSKPENCGLTSSEVQLQQLMLPQAARLRGRRGRAGGTRGGASNGKQSYSSNSRKRWEAEDRQAASLAGARHPAAGCRMGLAGCNASTASEEGGSPGSEGLVAGHAAQSFPGSASPVALGWLLRAALVGLVKGLQEGRDGGGLGHAVLCRVVDVLRDQVVPLLVLHEDHLRGQERGAGGPCVAGRSSLSALPGMPNHRRQCLRQRQSQRGATLAAPLQVLAAANAA